MIDKYKDIIINSIDGNICKIIKDNPTEINYFLNYINSIDDINDMQNKAFLYEIGMNVPKFSISNN